MTAVECLAALAGAVLGWKAGELLNELRSMKRPAVPSTSLLALPAATRLRQAPASPRAGAGQTGAGRLERLWRGGATTTAGASARTSGEKGSQTRAR
jgi:hypothetical protein